MTPHRLLRIAVVHIPALVLAALVLPYLALWSRLPDPVATHWSGAPNGYMPRVLELVLTVAPWLLLAGRAAWPTLKHTVWDQPPGKEPSLLVPPLTTLYFIAGVVLVAHTLIIWANLDVKQWTSARHLETIPTVASVLAVAGLLAWAGRLVENRLAAVERNEPIPPPALELDLDERVMWWGHATNHGLLLFSAGTSVFLLLGNPSTSQGPLRYAIPLLVLVVGLLFATVHVTANRSTVLIELGPWRWPRKTIRVGDLRDVSVRELQPLRYGGWGYRSCGSRCRAFIIRRGNALVMSLDDGRTVMVTVNDAANAASLLRALLASSSTNV